MYAELSWESMGHDLILQNNTDFNRDEFNDISDFNNAEID